MSSKLLFAFCGGYQATTDTREDDIDTFIASQHTVPQPVTPVAYQVILEPGIGQFREIESMLI